MSECVLNELCDEIVKRADGNVVLRRGKSHKMLPFKRSVRINVLCLGMGLLKARTNNFDQFEGKLLGESRGMYLVSVVQEGVIWQGLCVLSKALLKEVTFTGTRSRRIHPHL